MSDHGSRCIDECETLIKGAQLLYGSIRGYDVDSASTSREIENLSPTSQPSVVSYLHTRVRIVIRHGWNTGVVAKTDRSNMLTTARTVSCWKQYSTESFQQTCRRARRQDT